MSLYSRILETILFPKGSEGLVVVPVPSKTESVSTGEYRIPGDLFPEHCALEYLQNEDYPRQLEHLICERQPKRLFILPLLRNWREDRERWARYSSSSRTSYSARADTATPALQLALDFLTSSARVGILVPSVFLTASSTDDFRKEVAENHHVDVVIEHAHATWELGMSNLPSSLKLATLVITKGPAAGNSTFFFRFESPDEETIERELSRIQNPEWMQSEHGYRITRALDPAARWSFLFHDPVHWQQQKEAVRHFGGQPIRLSDMAELIPTVQRFGLLEIASAQEIGRSMVPVLSGRNVSQQGEIDVGDVERGALDYEYQPECILQPDDLVIRLLYQSSAEQLVVGRIEGPLSPLVADDSLCVLRRKEDVSAEQWAVVRNYLRSVQAFDALRAVFGEANRIFPRALLGMQIPVVTADVRSAIRQLQEAEAAHLDWAAEARGALSQLLSIPDSRTRRYEILETSRRVRQRWEAAREINESKTRARRLFPHPIAYRWKVIETAYPDYEGYKNILECAEVTIAYLACVALVAATEKGVVCKAVNKEASKLANGQGTGKTFGFWRSVLAQLRDSVPHGDPYSTPFFEFFNYPMTNQAIADLADEAFRHLYDQRNKDAHNEGPKGFEVEDAYAVAYEKLQFMLEAAAFLTEFPLIYIEKTRRDTLRNRTYYDARELMGDHHLVPLQREIETDRDDLEAGSLYIQDREGKLHLLRPYLVHHQAAKENRAATYYLNTFDPDTRTATLRGLELGDTVEDREIDKYVQAGLLKFGGKTP